MFEEKAIELGRLIGQSEEYKAVVRANDALKADAEAVGHLQRMDQLRQDAQAMMSRNEEPTEEMERELDELLSKVQAMPVYQRMAVTQENLDKLMRRVNDWIGEGIVKGAKSPIITLG
jgi:cell fate (sporulation/competence/biofilm development) regulator YlbF (YheA/YmcA/DUF963 family)